MMMPHIFKSSGEDYIPAGPASGGRIGKPHVIDEHADTVAFLLNPENRKPRPVQESLKRRIVDGLEDIRIVGHFGKHLRIDPDVRRWREGDHSSSVIRSAIIDDLALEGIYGHWPGHEVVNRAKSAFLDCLVGGMMRGPASADHQRD